MTLVSSQGQRTTLSGQISQFQETLTLKLPLLFQNQDELTQYLTKSVFLIDIGGNDYLNNYLQPERYDSSRLYDGEAFADLLRDTLTSQITVRLLHILIYSFSSIL